MNTGTFVTPQELVSQDIQLVSLPELCLEVESLVDLPQTTAADLGEVISKDTALSTRLLKLVNSAFFGLTRKVDTLSRAVNLIGMQELRNLTLAASATEVFADIDSRLIDMSAFWQHSIYCGLIARKLAKKAHVLHSERLFTAGLLHDVGRLLLLMKLPDEMGSVVSEYHKSRKNVCELEIEHIGFDHAEAGAALLAHWNLPTSLCSSVRFHHAPAIAEDAHLESSILHLADRITHSAQESWRPENPHTHDPFRALLNSDLNAEDIAVTGLHSADARAVQLTGVDDEAATDAIRQAAVEFDQVLDLLYPYMSEC